MFVANSSVCPFRRVFMKLSMIRASGPFAWTVMVYVTFVAVPSGIPGRGTQRLSNTLQPASGVVHGAAVGFAEELRPEISSIRERGRGPPPFCLGGWGSRDWTQPFRRNGRPVRLFTPTFRFFGISSIGLPLFGFRLLKK